MGWKGEAQCPTWRGMGQAERVVRALNLSLSVQGWLDGHDKTDNVDFVETRSYPRRDVGGTRRSGGEGGRDDGIAG
jgi:hypothetical protein